MCCIFTCCGWLVDLVQRLWTFTMSCCISSSICCLLATGSMSGIALGYNYSLAEYMDLKETNVSIFLKRGVFDDDLSELEWRRAGHIPVRGYNPTAGLKGVERDMLEADGTTAPSRRRLDDSIIDVGDQNRYEGSLFKLTAKPPIAITDRPEITPGTELNMMRTKYEQGSLDSLKAVQNIIDARKSMAQQYGGTTVTPVPTYPFHEAERMYPAMLGSRRDMKGEFNDMKGPNLSPARLAVPNEQIGLRRLWMAPKFPNLQFVSETPGYLPDPETVPTYPSPVTFRTGPIRPKHDSTTNLLGDIVMLTRTRIYTLFSTAPSSATDPEVRLPDQKPTIEAIKERLMMANDLPIRKQKPKPEEEYDYDIKGLPVRKRRSIDLNKSTNEEKEYVLRGSKIEKIKEQDSASIPNIYDILNLISLKDIFNSYNAHLKQNNTQNILSNKEESKIEAINVSKQGLEKENQPVSIIGNMLCDLGYKIQTPDRLKVSEPNNNLVTHLKLKLKSFLKLSQNDELIDASKEVNNENSENIKESKQNLYMSKVISTEHKTNTENTGGFSTTQATFGDHKTSDNILGYMFNEKDIMKSTSSVLVSMLLSTIA